MHSRAFFILSLTLNVALGFLAWLQRSHSPPPISSVQTLKLLSAEHLTTPRPRQQLSPVLGASWDAAWASLERGDFRGGLAKLRNLNFPEAIIRDIMAGAVSRRFGPEIVALRQVAPAYWEPVQRRKPDLANSEGEREQRARQLESERNSLLQELVGLDWSTYQSQVSGRPDPVDRYLEGLQQSSKPMARAILAKYDGLERDVIRGCGGTLGLPERREMDRLYQEKIQDLKKYLAPSEIQEFELRASPTAAHLRQIGLVGFDPTEEEFRTIFRVRQALDEQSLVPVNLEDDNSRVPTWMAHYAMEDELRRALGDQRYRDYRRSQDYTYRGLIELTDEFDLPHSCAVEIHDLRETVLQQVRSLGLDVPSDQRSEVLRRLATETEQSVRNTLGIAAFERYTQSQIGGWIEEIARQ